MRTTFGSVSHSRATPSELIERKPWQQMKRLYRMGAVCLEEINKASNAQLLFCQPDT